jgi:transcriptional regulator with XRE-family HTH domain
MTDETPLGALIREQRECQDLSMRRLAQLAGISNPYLSQIERGLRDPSEKVLDAIATHLKLSTDALNEQAGRARAAPAGDAELIAAIKADPRLSAKQRQAMLEVYIAFVGSGANTRFA